MTKIIWRHDSTPSPTTVLAAGEPAYNLVNILKIGDGTTAWSALPYFVTASQRGVFSTGLPGSGYVNILEYVSIPEKSNTEDFGDATTAGSSTASCASSTRGVIFGTNNNLIDYITIAIKSNATDFVGRTLNNVFQGAAFGSQTRGIICVGYEATYSKNMNYITYTQIINAVDFGDLITAEYRISGCASQTRGVVGQGQNTVARNVLEYVTISSAGGGTSFGALTTTYNAMTSCSNSVTGFFAGGTNLTTNIEKITIATTGTNGVYAYLTVGRYAAASVSSPTRAVFGGGFNGTIQVNTIDYIEMSTGGAGTDFGDLVLARWGLGACSNSHGGL